VCVTCCLNCCMDRSRRDQMQVTESFQVTEPLIITSRLLPGIKVGACTISLKPGKVTGHRQQWTGIFDLKRQFTVHVKDYECLRGRSLRNVCADWIGFLHAFAEAVDPKSENHDLFPIKLRPWAEANEDELSLLSAELSEEG
jgi:hypothetical protein